MFTINQLVYVKYIDNTSIFAFPPTSSVARPHLWSRFWVIYFEWRIFWYLASSRQIHSRHSLIRSILIWIRRIHIIIWVHWWGHWRVRLPIHIRIWDWSVEIIIHTGIPVTSIVRIWIGWVVGLIRNLFCLLFFINTIHKSFECDKKLLLVNDSIIICVHGLDCFTRLLLVNDLGDFQCLKEIIKK